MSEIGGLRKNSNEQKGGGDMHLNILTDDDDDDGTMWRNGGGGSSEGGGGSSGDIFEDSGRIGGLKKGERRDSWSKGDPGEEDW
jgi:hypothetical protein